ncbi:MAG TPA: ricin-type beta-trefoil lectin domain protein [Trebonia sp.]|nr:ricin-type beta-trefoil lectin domain protein [Trebonia sp.]
MRRFGMRAGVVSACLLGLASLAGTSTAEGATLPTSSSASSPDTVAPDTLAPDVKSPEAAKAMDLPPGTQSCPAPTSLLQMQCMVLINHSEESAGTVIRPGSAATRDLTPVNDALGPPDLQAAYGLAGATGAAATDGAGQTVAVVDAYGDPGIQSDLAKYRANWTLPACSGTGAGCLTVFNQKGATTTSSLPKAPAGENKSWEDETALDVEMISAICPKCAIDLFEANTAQLSDLGTAENSAAKVTKFISNSWGALEDFPGESVYDSMYFNHPGVVIDFASGDSGFGAVYPAASQLVTSVGGTYLTTSGGSATGYAETVWNGQVSGPGAGTGAGCSGGEGKPSWQTDGGCLNRTENDVAAAASAPKGIDEYSSSGDCTAKNGAFDEADDCAVYGTSVATPIITAIYALAGTPVAHTYPVSYLYQSGHAAGLNHVESGQIGTCESSRRYLCNAADSLGNGYNGPTGLGTPNGIAAFQSTATGDIVSAINPGTYDLRAGIRVSLPAIKAYDSGSGQTLAYSASGLPSGLSINSATGAISGTLAATPVNDKVKVTVKDGTGASAAISFGIATVKAMATNYHPGFGEVKLDLDGKCMNDGYNDTHVDAPISIYPCQVSSSQDWSYSMPPAPGSAGRISIHGKCLYILGKTNSAGSHLIGLANCANSSALLWVLTGYAGAIVNPATGDCITDPNSSTTNNTQLTAQPCTTSANQAWTMSASPVTSGIAGKCLAVSGGSAISTACSGSTAQRVTLGLDGSLRFGGYCLYNAGGGGNDGTAIKELGCNGSSAELWGISAYGQIQNLLSRKCLAVPGNSSANGAKLELEDCYGQPGEVWAAS